MTERIAEIRRHVEEVRRECVPPVLKVEIAEELLIEVTRLTEALGITRGALKFYEADHGDPRDTRPWTFDYERRRWYFAGSHPSDVADFALRKASLAERGEPPPVEDYLGRAKAAALGGQARCCQDYAIPQQCDGPACSRYVGRG